MSDAQKTDYKNVIKYDVFTFILSNETFSKTIFVVFYKLVRMFMLQSS